MGKDKEGKEIGNEEGSGGNKRDRECIKVGGGDGEIMGGEE